MDPHNIVTPELYYVCATRSLGLISALSAPPLNLAPTSHIAAAMWVLHGVELRVSTWNREDSER
jgi:hypothetical protein